MLPEELGHELVELTRRSLGDQARSPALRLVPGESVHLTLAFLGEVEDSRVPRLSGCLREGLHGLRRPVLALDGTGCFPRRGSERVLWFGLRELEMGGLEGLWRRTCQVLEGGGFERARAGERFVPHLSVARVRRGPGLPRFPVADEFYGLRLERRWEPGQVCLLESRSGPGQDPPSYGLLEAFEVGGPAAPPEP